MAQIIGLPKLSPTMEEGVLVRWTKQEGEKVSPGDLVAEVETDKANMDFTIEDEGVLLKLLVKEGDTVKLGAPVAILGKAGENIDALVAQAAGGAAAAAPNAAPKQEAPAPAQKQAPAPKQQATGDRQPATGNRRRRKAGGPAGGTRVEDGDGCANKVRREARAHEGSCRVAAERQAARVAAR